MRKWLIIVVAIFVADQATKLIAQQLLAMHTPVPVLPFLNLTLVHNTGAAFSLLSDAGGWQRWFFVIVTVVICSVLVGWLRRLPSDDTLSAFGIVLILGGAVGNLFDRLAYGYVVDFLDAHYQHYHWPVFNIADACVTVGALLIVLAAIFEKKSEV